MRSIELVLDPASDAAVRSAWSALVAADLPSLGRHPSPSNAPHVTLAAGEGLPVPRVPAVPLPASVTLGGLLLFPAGPGRSVLVRAVVVDRALAAFHEAVHEAVRGTVPASVVSTLPGRWSPHVTLARRVRDEDLPAAVAALRSAQLPEVLGVGGVRHWDGGTKTVTPVV
ncbi:2'-5' RNA ligase family protein [Curtobacterium sp. 22159]|uniref:2'-5' RNA ligase family protein n=1 Tax=Curtobacterium sp. 22159 TaxID=3453882 RepID=UPI003F86C4A0